MKDLVADGKGSLVPSILSSEDKKTFGTRVVKKIEGYIESVLLNITHSKKKC